MYNRRTTVLKISSFWPVHPRQCRLVFTTSYTVYLHDIRICIDNNNHPPTPELMAAAIELNMPCHPPFSRPHTSTILDTFEWVIEAIDNDIDAVWHALQPDDTP